MNKKEQSLENTVGFIELFEKDGTLYTKEGAEAKANPIGNQINFVTTNCHQGYCDIYSLWHEGCRNPLLQYYKPNKIANAFRIVTERCKETFTWIPHRSDPPMILDFYYTIQYYHIEQK